jgi:hypothetical protein
MFVYMRAGQPCRRCATASAVTARASTSAIPPGAPLPAAQGRTGRPASKSPPRR